MPEPRDVKVFISWSGDLSKAVAVALREWLPLLFDRVGPWASDVDIAAGQRGLAQIEAELGGTQFGIVVVTTANQAAPWLNFEAGALSKAIPGDFEHRVVPLLVDLSGPTQLTGPLSQFQAKVADREGTQALLRSLGAVAGIDPGLVEQRFEAYWSRLEQRIDAAKGLAAQKEQEPTQPRRETHDLLEEILVHVRQLRTESEGSARSSGRSPAPRRGSQIDSNRVKSALSVMAATFGFEVLEAEVVDGRLDVTVVPEAESNFSKKSYDQFSKALRLAWDGDVQVAYVPF